MNNCLKCKKAIYIILLECELKLQLQTFSHLKDFNALRVAEYIFKCKFMGFFYKLNNLN